jgi:LysR family glycine cleavage system transcriptional activator
MHVEWFESETSFRTLAWERWFAEAGVEVERPLGGMHLSHTFAALQLAIAGHGVALASDCLSANAVASGLLVRPFDTRLRAPRDYYLVYAEGGRGHSKISAFQDWLVGEMAAPPRA